MIRVGIGGWDFAPWRGTFYPADLKKKDELAYASGRLTSIEVNATFYRLQSPSTFAKWRDGTPDDFVFSLKGSRYACQGAELGRGLDRFFASGVDELGPKLGAVLWQLRGAVDEAKLVAFLDLLPQGRRHAVEMKQPVALGEFRKRGIAVAVIDDDGYEMVAEDTASFVYARLKRSPYDAKALDAWAERFRGKDGYVYFISGEKVRAPEMAMALIERLGR